MTLQNGWRHTLGALIVVTITAAVIAASTWSRSQSAGRLAIGGVVLFGIALGLGSGRLVTLTSVPILGAALMTFVGSEQPAWSRAAVVGVLWYLAAEMAWDAIERRDGVRRTTPLNTRRINEISTVVLVSIGVSAAAILLSGWAPVRTVLLLGIAVVCVAVVLVAVTQGLRHHEEGSRSLDH